jgi:hypothetical protein
VQNAPPVVATQLYQACLLLYPATFRRQFGEEMLCDFEAATRDAWRLHGWVGVGPLWALVLTDLVRSIAAQWLGTGVPLLIGFSVVWSATMCTLIAQQFGTGPSPLAQIPAADDDQPLILVVMATALVLLIIAIIVVTGSFWLFVVRRAKRA